MSKSGWSPLPAGSRSNAGYLKRLNKRKPFLLPALLMFFLSLCGLAVLIF